MSCSYADGLSPYENKGKLGLAEKFETEKEVNAKVLQLAAWLKEAQHVVVHTGAGISTSAGIPDFRGPNGVWTLEAKGLKPDKNVAFDEAVPTKTHMALLKLVECGLVKYIISQNIDGLHLRSGLPRKHLAELHGNMYIEQCNQCGKQFVREKATTSVGQKCLNKPCLAARGNGRPCRGRLHDTILDWEHNLPESDLHMSDYHSSVADLSLCLGTTLQIIPSGNLPLATKKCNGRLVICNLQPTKHDRKADLIINSYVDEVMLKLMEVLELPVESYNPDLDPSVQVKTCNMKNSYIEWTIQSELLLHMKALYECKRKQLPKKNVKRKKDDIKCAKLCKTEDAYNEMKTVTVVNFDVDLKRTKHDDKLFIKAGNSRTDEASEHVIQEGNTDDIGLGLNTSENACDIKRANGEVKVTKFIKIEKNGEATKYEKNKQIIKTEDTEVTSVSTTINVHGETQGNVPSMQTLCDIKSKNNEENVANAVYLDKNGKGNNVEESMSTYLRENEPEGELPGVSTSINLGINGKTNGNSVNLQTPFVNNCKLENMNTLSTENLGLDHIKMENVN